VNRKRVYRLYRLENINVRLKSQIKQVARPLVEQVKESRANEV